MAEGRQPQSQTPLQSPHFLVVSFPAQGHVNPTLQLAKRLTRLGARVTFSTAIPTHRRISPPSPPSDAPPPLLRYSPYSIGDYDDGRAFETVDRRHFLHLLETVGRRTLAEVAAEGLPVTCVVYNFLVPWAADVARELGVPSVLYWIQPAAVFAVYYHYFHGYADQIAAHCNDPFFSVDLPGLLPPFRIRDLPSIFLSKSPDDDLFFPTIEQLFRSLDRQIDESKGGSKVRILVNTFEALERDQIRAAPERLELVPIGPALPSAYTDGVDADDTAFGSDLFEQDSKDRYAGWLDAQVDRSVVYISFGSYSVLSPSQREEITRALAELRRCLDLVMGDGEEGVKLRRNAAAWREKAREAVRQGGSSDRNLRDFVNGFPFVDESN